MILWAFCPCFPREKSVCVCVHCIRAFCAIHKSKRPQMKGNEQFVPLIIGLYAGQKARRNQNIIQHIFHSIIRL